MSKIGTVYVKASRRAMAHKRALPGLKARRAKATKLIHKVNSAIDRVWNGKPTDRNLALLRRQYRVYRYAEQQLGLKIERSNPGNWSINPKYLKAK